jgi:hypothetical protein
MHVKHATYTRFVLAAPLALVCGLSAPHAFAQAPAPTAGVSPVAPAEGATGAAPEAAPPAPTADKAPESAADLGALRAELDEVKRALDEVKAQQAEAAAAATSEEGSSSDGEPLKLYGFMDMGVQHIWVRPDAPLAHIFQVNNTSFVVGNINLYVDAQPIKHFRGLAELRFTNSPLGDITNYGGLAGTFKRTNTFSYDSGGTAINAPMWSASVILERAWIEWNEHQALKFRVGNYFTPFGIWNEDHGTPTLISLALPQFIVQRWMPIRQTGIMLYGSAFAGDWELGYTGTLSNGRQEISNYNFDNNFGLGARVYARRDTGQVNTTFGLSYFTGKTMDKETDVVADPNGINGLSFVDKTTLAYSEHVAGADVSIDVDATRIRAEGVVRRLVYEPGHRVPGDPLFAPGSFAPNSWQECVYLLVANQLPWFGIEPYLWGEVQEQPTVLGDLIWVGSVGVNVHFNSAIQLKTQATRAVFTNWLYKSPYDNSLNDATTLYSRFVMAF